MRGAWQSWAPLTQLVIAGAALRLLAAIYSHGYLMHDDHFLVVEAAASWTDGADYNDWLPWSQEAKGKIAQPHPANFFYVGTQFVTLTVLKAAGIASPKFLALSLRILHGLYSLLAIVFAFRLGEALGGKRTAWWAGAMVSGWAWMPLLSVHQLVEAACIPPLLFAAWQLAKQPRDAWDLRTMIYAGIGLGLATGLRYQCGLFAVGWAIAWTYAAIHSNSKGSFLKEIKLPILLVFISLFTFTLTQIQDVFIWGEPFVQLRAYFGYNTTHALQYPQGPWHQYIWTILGMVTPPLAVALVFGMTQAIRKVPHAGWLVAGVLVFFLFHSGYSNKQERFILPMLPFLAAIGSAGWLAWRGDSSWWKRHLRLERGLIYWTAGFHLVLAIAFGFVYAKKSRVEAMNVLYERGDLENFAVVQVDGGTLAPRFYCGQWVPYYEFDLSHDPARERELMCKKSATYPFPNYLLFYGDSHLGEAVQAYKAEYPQMKFIANVAPGRFDRLLTWLNPINSTERVMIYQVTPEHCCGMEN